LNFASNPSGFRNNPSSIANLNSKYLENPQGEPVFWAQVALFGRRPLLKRASFDAELNSAPNLSGFRNNPSRIANPEKKKPNLVLTLPTSLFFIFRNKDFIYIYFININIYSIFIL